MFWYKIDAWLGMSCRFAGFEQEPEGQSQQPQPQQQPQPPEQPGTSLDFGSPPKDAPPSESDCNLRLQPELPGFDRRFDRAYACVMAKATSLAPHLKGILRGVAVPLKCSVEVDLKQAAETRKKFLKKRKYQTLMDMPDILRAAVLAPQTEDLQLISERLCRRIGNCKIDPKDEKSGYIGAIHLDVVFGGMRVEVQVNYKNAWVYKAEAHKEYKNPEGNEALMRDRLSRPHVKRYKELARREQDYMDRKKKPDSTSYGYTGLSPRTVMRTWTDASRTFNLRRMANQEKGMIDYAALVEEAREYARDRHSGAKRNYSDVDFFVHPERVALVARELGLPPEDVIVAYLHDVIEDVPALKGIPREELRKEIEDKFGPDIASMVIALTNPSQGSRLPREERKKMDREHMMKVPERVRIIKAIDRIDNLRDVIRSWDKVSPEYRKMYVNESLLMADALLQGGASESLVRLVEDLRQEANRLGALPGLVPEPLKNNRKVRK